MSFLLRSLAAAVLSLCLVAGSARASQVVFGNLGSDGLSALDGNTTSNSTLTTWFAQGFTVSSPRLFLDTVSLGFASTATATLSLYSSSAGLPGSSLISLTQAVTGSAGSPNLISFNFNGYSLTSGSSYWLVLSSAGASSVNWASNNDDNSSTGQNGSGWSALGGLRTVNSGSSWNSNSGPPVRSLSITASSSSPEPIPEPGTWAAAALLIGAAAYVRWRRRRQVA